MKRVFALLLVSIFASLCIGAPVQIRNDNINVKVIDADSSLKTSAFIKYGSLPAKVLSDSSLKVSGSSTISGSVTVNDTNKTPRRVYVWDGSDTAKIDSKGGIVTIDLPHSEIHLGEYFYSLIDTTLATASSDTLKAVLWDSLKTGEPIHCVIEIYSNNGSGTVDIFESDSDFVGTVVPVLNRNRNSANTTQWTVRKNIALKGGGTLIYHNEFGSSTSQGGNKLGGQKRDENELILNPLKRYKIIGRVTGNTTNVNIEIHFYE